MIPVDVDALRQRFERRLASALPRASGPTQLAEAMRYSVLAPGKRLRPMLVLLSAEAHGGDVDTAMPAACAIEAVHAYSLVHDDLPAMDDDDLRRGRPTNHKVFGEAMAILAGDALLTHAFTMIARTEPPEAAARLAALLAECSGPKGMVGGQAADVALEGRSIDRKTLKYIHTHKTADLIRCAVAMGAVAARADEASIESIERFGADLGLAFQVQDDILDEVSTEVEMGKAVGKDAAHGKTTYPVLLGLDKSRSYFVTLLRRARKRLTESLGVRGASLWSFVSDTFKECPESLKGPLDP